MINYFCSVYISSSKHYEGPGGTEGEGKRGGMEVEIDISTSLIASILPMKTALCVFFCCFVFLCFSENKSDERPFCFFTFTTFLHAR